VPSLRRDLERYAALPCLEASALGFSDDPALLVELTRTRRYSGDVCTGSIDLGDLLLALFEPPLNLAPVFAHNGLQLKDAQAQLPKALKAASLYEVQATNLGTSPPPPLHDVRKALLPRLSEAMRVARAREPQGDHDGDEKWPRAARSTSSTMNPWSPVEVEAEMAEFAPRSAKRAGEKRPVLASCGVDLVERARQGCLDPVVGRDEEIARVLQILSRRTKNNVALVGAPGVGKTAVAEAIAQHIAAGRVPPQLEECQELWSLDMGALLAGTGLRGDFEERLRDVLSEVRASQGAALLFIDELHLVLGAGRSENNNVDAANLMKPMLARGEIRCIGATTSIEYQQLILAKDAAFERRFQVVELVEPSESASTLMLEELLPLYAKHHRLNVPTRLAEAAVKASQRCVPGRHLPDKAIDVLDEACCLAVEEEAEEVTVTHVEAVAARWQFPKCAERPLSWLPDGMRSVLSKLRSRL